MRKPHRSFVLVVLACAVFASQSLGAQSSPAAATDVAKVADAYVTASLAGDAKAVAALYTEDAVELPPYNDHGEGKSRHRAVPTPNSSAARPSCSRSL